MKRILVTGSRDWWNYHTVFEAIDREAAGFENVIVHGDAPGADSMAEDIAKFLRIPTERHPAKWDVYGKFAGPLRNQEMVNAGANVCLAFIRNNSRGATHCARLAEKAGIPVRYFRINDKATT